MPRLWTFRIDNERVWSQDRPPPWTDTMADAELHEPPPHIAAEFTPEACDAFRRKHGAPLHTVIEEEPGKLTRHAWVC